MIVTTMPSSANRVTSILKVSMKASIRSRGDSATMNPPDPARGRTYSRHRRPAGILHQAEDPCPLFHRGEGGRQPDKGIVGRGGAAGENCEGQRWGPAPRCWPPRTTLGIVVAHHQVGGQARPPGCSPRPGTPRRRGGRRWSGYDPDRRSGSGCECRRSRAPG